MAARRPLVSGEYLARLVDGLGGRLSERDRHRIRALCERPEFRSAAVFDLERRYRQALGIDPREAPPFVNPLPELLPAGEIPGPRLVRGAGVGERVSIPATAALPAALFVGQNRRGKSWAAYQLANAYLDEGVAAVAFDYLDGGWTRAAAGRGPGRARIIDARSWLANPLQPEPGEALSDAVGRVKACLRPLWVGANMLGALERLVDDAASALAAAGGGHVCLEDVWHRLGTTPARALGRSAEARDVLRDRLQGPRAQLSGQFAFREGFPTCRLLDRGVLTVFHLPGVAAENVALFARFIDVALEAHIRAHPVHAPPRPGFPLVLEILEEAAVHLPSATAGLPEGGDFFARRGLTCRHTHRAFWAISQLGDHDPAFLQAVGLLIAFPLPTARSRFLMGDRLGLEPEARDWLLAETQPPREAALKYVGGPGALHVRFDETAAPPSDESAVRAETERELATWRAACVPWAPPAAGWEPVVARMEARAANAASARGEQSALEDMVSELRERLLRYLARVGERLELRGDRANELGISTDDEQRLCALAEQHGWAATQADRIGKNFEVVVLTASGRALVASRDPKASFVECGQEGWVHRFIADAVVRAVCDEVTETEVRRHGAYGPPGNQVRPDLVLLVPGNSPDGSWDLRVAVNVQCSGNGEREANAACRLARVAELTHVAVVSRTARMALETSRRLRRLLTDEPAVLAKLRVTDAGKVLQGRGLLAFVVAGTWDDDA